MATVHMASQVLSGVHIQLEMLEIEIHYVFQLCRTRTACNEHFQPCLLAVLVWYYKLRYSEHVACLCSGLSCVVALLCIHSGIEIFLCIWWYV